MEAKKENRANDDGREQNLTDVVVEDLLVRTRNVTGMILFRIGNFRRDDRDGLGGYVLVYFHVLTPLVATQNYPCVTTLSFWGVPLFPGARVFITKVPPYYNCFLQLFADYLQPVAAYLSSDELEEFRYREDVRT